MAQAPEPNFKAGSLVFAKARGFPYWPARVESKVEGTYYVYFYGTHETTTLNVSNLVPFNEETKKKYGRVKRKYFREAMETIQTNPNYKADCVFNIPATTARKKIKPVSQSQRKRRPSETFVPPPLPKAPREPPKRRSPPPTTEGGAEAFPAKRKRKQTKGDDDSSLNRSENTWPSYHSETNSTQPRPDQQQQYRHHYQQHRPQQQVPHHQGGYGEATDNGPNRVGQSRNVDSNVSMSRGGVRCDYRDMSGGHDASRRDASGGYQQSESKDVPRKTASVERPMPVMYEYLNSERSPAEMGRLPLIKRREPPRDVAPVAPSELSSALPLLKPAGSASDDATGSAKDLRDGKSGRGEREPQPHHQSFSSPIKKRKLSPPKKAPERYLESAPPRRNSVQRKEVAAASSRSGDDSASESSSAVESSRGPAKIGRSGSASAPISSSGGTASGSATAGKRASASADFKAREMVFAKVKGFPFWPARVDSVLSSTKPIRYQIFFYGTHEHAKLTAKDLLPVNAETMEKHGKPNKRSRFADGLLEMEYNPWVEFPGGGASAHASGGGAGNVSGGAAAGVAGAGTAAGPLHGNTGMASLHAGAASAGVGAGAQPAAGGNLSNAGSGSGPPAAPIGAGGGSIPSVLPPVTLVPQLNVQQQTSPQSPQGSSQKTGCSDKDDSDTFSDSSDSVGGAVGYSHAAADKLWHLLDSHNSRNFSGSSTRWSGAYNMRGVNHFKS